MTSQIVEYKTKANQIYLPVYFMLGLGILLPLIITGWWVGLGFLVLLVAILYFLFSKPNVHVIDEVSNTLSIHRSSGTVSIDINKIAQIKRWQHEGAITFPVAFNGPAIISSTNMIYKLSVDKEREFIAHLMRLNPEINYIKDFVK